MRPYVIRRHNPVVVATTLLSLGLFAAVLVGVLDRRPSPFWLVIIAFSAFSYWRGTSVLRIGPDGVRIGRGWGYQDGRSRVLSVTVPWSSIAEVLVLHGPTGQERLAVRLRPDAPLPGGVRGVIRDPNAPGPIPPELSTVLPRTTDRAGIFTAVAAFGGGVPVVDGAAG